MKTDYKFFNNITAITTLILSLLLAGCEVAPVNQKPSVEADLAARNASVNTAASIDAPLVSANDSLLAMLRYSRFVNGLSKERVAEEFKRVNDAYFVRPNDRSGLKRAILLMIPATDFYDLQQAKQLFTDIMSSSDDSVPAFKEYAEFMLSVLDAQEQANIRYNKLMQELQQETLKREQAEQKLEALKSIEENMIQRRTQ